jgi:putative endonuclease
MHPFFDELRYFVNFQGYMRVQNELGRRGESIAAKWLKSKGYRILERNYRFGRAEIDLLAQKGDTLAVVEVKMRGSGQLEPLSVAVNPSKRERLIKAADHYVLKNDLDVEVRFDIIHIIHHDNRSTLKHLEGAFSPY